MSQNKPKTQESMQKQLEEWRKAKQKPTRQLKPKTTPLKTPNREIKAAPSHKKNISSLKRTVSSRPSSIHKAKENSGVGIKSKPVPTLKTTAEKTADDHERKGKNSKNETTHDEKSQINPTDELVFGENPPSNFEIESEPDAKKARRSTFTMDSPTPEVNDQGTVKTQPSLREQLETWRAEKSKLQAKTNVKSRHHIAKHKNSKEPIQSKSLKTKGLVGRDSSKQTSSSRPATSNSRPQTSNTRPTTSNARPTTSNTRPATSNTRPTTSNTRPATSNTRPTTSKTRLFPKKTEIRKHDCANKTPKKVVQTPKPLDASTRNLLKTPSVKTPVYMDQSLPVRERLELWRKEKRKTMPWKFPQTPSTLRKGTKPKQGNKESTKAKGLEPVKTQPSEMMNDQMNEKETTQEEINTEKEVSPEGLKQEFKKKLQECLIKVKEDENSLDDISCQLDEIQKDHPGAIQCAEFWVCRAKIAEYNGDHGRVVCLYEQASAFSAEPESLINDEFSAYSLRRKGEEEQTDACSQDVKSSEDQFDQSHGVPVPPRHPATPHRVRHTSEIMSPSSIIRYSVTKGTPYRSRLKTERPTVTPVRRSVRLQRRSVNYPIMLQEHGLTVKHLDELPQDIREEVSFRPNFAVQSELNDAWKEIMEC